MSTDRKRRVLMHCWSSCVATVMVCSLWPEALTEMDRLSSPHYVGFGFCCGSKKTDERQSSVAHAHHRFIRVLILNRGRGFFCLESRGQPTQGRRYICRQNRAGHACAVPHHFHHGKRDIAKHGDVGIGLGGKCHQHTILLERPISICARPQMPGKPRASRRRTHPPKPVWRS